VDDDFLEILLRHRLQRMQEVGTVGAARAVGPVAAQAGFRIAAPAVVGGLVDLAVLHLVGLVLGRCADPAGGPDRQSRGEREHEGAAGERAALRLMHPLSSLSMKPGGAAAATAGERTGILAGPGCP